MEHVLLIFGLMGLFILMDVPVAFALGIASLAFLVLATKVPLVVVVQRLYLGVDSFVLLAVPLFVMAGILMNTGGLSKKIVDFSSALVGHMRGGLAAVNVVASMFFAGVSGTSMADTAAVGGVLIPAMINKGYRRDFAAAVTACSSTIGIIIPPSVPMILYGAFVGVSVGTLFIAGIIPGIAIGLGQILVAYVISKREGYGSEEPFSLRIAGMTGVKAIPVILLAGLIIGGIIGGIFTPTEAAGVAVVYAFVLSALYYRDLSLRSFYGALRESALVTGSVMLVISVANLLGWVLAYARIPQKLVDPILGLTTSPIVFMWLVSVVLIVAGVFMHGTALLVVLAPLFLPIVARLGIHPLQFAMVFIMCWGIGQQTPPVASALFITCTLAEVDMWMVTKANLPFVAVLVAVLAGIIHFPGVFVFFVPRLLGLI